MKFFQNWSLKQWAVGLATMVLVLIIGQLALLNRFFQSVEEVQTQIDFTRSAQLQAQSVELDFSRFKQDALQAPPILAGLNKQAYYLKLIKEGGRIPNKPIFLPPLQRLPSITFTKLEEDFNAYSSLVTQHLKPADSTDVAEVYLYAQSQWVLVSDWYSKLIGDLYDEWATRKASFSWLLGIIIVFDVLLLAGLVLVIIKKIIQPLRVIASNTSNHQHTRGVEANEIGAVAEQINEVIEHFRDASDFIKSIGAGKLDIDYKTELDSGYVLGKNQLADSLIDMQAKLRSMHEEDQRRKWANEGLAKFVDILRSEDDDLNKLGDNIISTLVQYTRANQGALYVVNEEENGTKFLEQIALYAFDSKKFQSYKLKLGEGLTGQAYLERDTLYLTEIPEEYVRITSGLGDANPKSLLIVPLKVDQDVYGIVELASFHEFKPHEISFVEKLGETIASTLASVKAAQNNRKLLEESKLAAEAMRSQEEEMRQNMEELTATQEEMQRILKEAQQKETYLSNLMDVTTDAFVAIDRDYKVVMCNNAPLFQQFAKDGIRYEPGYHVLGLFKSQERDHHKSLYDRAFNGETLEVNKEYYGKPYAISYSPLKSATGEIIGAAIFAHDQSEEKSLKHRIEELENQLAQPPVANASAELDSLDKALRINLQALQIAKEEIDRKRS
jgi:putative methionine-R-sulfoxide reductase with GAF domain/dihydroxyacetone kinase DhaKLM complex PTS-EIIA-like component DhaM